MSTPPAPSSRRQLFAAAALGAAGEAAAQTAATAAAPAASAAASAASAASPAPAASAAPAAAASAAGAAPALPAFFDELERRSFNYFWDTTNPANGLAPDRWPGGHGFASIAAVGFALTAYGIGAERGYITREQARARSLATVRFFRDAPQGDAARGMAGHRGFFYHFVTLDKGTRFRGTELSPVDTALMLAGMLFAQSYFDGEHADEREIREAVDAIYARVDWPWFCPRKRLLSLAWEPETGFHVRDWLGYSEAMLLYLLAIASPSMPLAPRAWVDWTATHDLQWGTFHGQQHLNFGPLFGHQYSHVWVDFRGIQDDYARSHGLDYFENSRRATLAQRAYAMANPRGWQGYGADVWGLTACDGPGHLWTKDRLGRDIEFRDYYARGASLHDTFDDGTIAPTAALGSLPFAPEIVVPAVLEMHRRHGQHIYGRYGFVDAFNENFVDARAKLSNGRVLPGFGWVDTDYVGIDQGVILAMIANHRSGFVWKVMRRNAHLVRGLKLAGFKGGWLGA